jgi:hypothetical protein
MLGKPVHAQRMIDATADHSARIHEHPIQIEQDRCFPKRRHTDGIIA